MDKIISLTSIPTRFKYLSETIDSLIKQNACNEIRLNIPKKYRRFPDWDGSIPKFPSKVNIVRCEEDLGPATKILPTALDHKNSDIQILFCDDDGIHPNNWARNLFELQQTMPDKAIATWGRCIDELPSVKYDPTKKYVEIQHLKYDVRYRFERLLHKIGNYQPLHRPVKRAGFAHILLGVGGVVVKPNFFNIESTLIPEEAFLVDDIWLSAQLALNKIEIFCPKRFAVPYSHEGESVNALFDMEIGGGRKKLNYQALPWCRNNLKCW